MPRAPLFDLDYSPEWGYDERFFHDVEHRYAKMHRLLRERWGDPAGERVVDLGSSRGLFLARFPKSERLGPISSLTRTPAPVAGALDRLADRLPSLSDHLIAYARRP